MLFAITAFAAHSGSFVIAEGIEDESTLQFIRGVQSTESAPIVVRGAQGYLLGRPVEGLRWSAHRRCRCDQSKNPM